MITLILYSIHFHRMRLTGAPYTHNGVWSSPINPAITPTGRTISATPAVPTTIRPTQSEAVGYENDDTHAPPRIETISTLSPIREGFVSPVESPRWTEGFEAQKSYAAGVVAKDARKSAELRHSGTFFIDDGIVTPMSAVFVDGPNVKSKV
jgi:hypothetical protein